MPAKITNTVPITERTLAGSEKTNMPIITLVVGSNALRIDVFSEPIRNALSWKSTTAMAVTAIAKSTEV